jgi:hypothetical protein
MAQGSNSSRTCRSQSESNISPLFLFPVQPPKDWPNSCQKLTTMAVRRQGDFLTYVRLFCQPVCKFARAVDGLNVAGA